MTRAAFAQPIPNITTWEEAANSMAKKHLAPANSAPGRNALTYLTAEERRKYELAKELGLLDLVREVGWAGLSAKDTGRIGGLIGQERRRPGSVT